MYPSIKTLSCILLINICVWPVWAQSQDPLSGPQVIQPEVDRRDIEVPKIDTENFEVSLFGGVLNMEDFGSNPVYGIRLGFHATEDFLIEASIGASSVSDTTIRDFGLSVFREEDENLFYYNLSLGWNVFPGEVFLWKKRAFTSSIYLITGAGNTNFNDEDFFTVNLGFGVKVLPKDYLSVRLEVRDHMFSSDLLGESKITNNIEVSGSLGYFF